MKGEQAAAETLGFVTWEAGKNLSPADHNYANNDKNSLGLFLNVAQHIIGSHDPSSQSSPPFQPGQPISSEQARTLPLSLRPMQRLAQLAEYGAGFGMRNIGWSPFPFVSRGELIRAAEAREQALRTIAALSKQDNE